MPGGRWVGFDSIEKGKESNIQDRTELVKEHLYSSAPPLLEPATAAVKGLQKSDNTTGAFLI